MPQFIGLDVSQRMTAICIVDTNGRRIGEASAPRPRRKSAWRCVAMRVPTQS